MISYCHWIILTQFICSNLVSIWTLSHTKEGDVILYLESYLSLTSNVWNKYAIRSIARIKFMFAISNFLTWRCASIIHVGHKNPSVGSTTKIKNMAGITESLFKENTKCLTISSVLLTKNTNPLHAHCGNQLIFFNEGQDQEHEVFHLSIIRNAF